MNNGKAMTAIGALLTASIILTFTGVISAGVPPIPDPFYGDLTVNGDSAPSGVTLVVKIAGIECGSYTTEQEGVYGNPEIKDYLLVEGTSDDIGKDIHFYIEDYKGDLVLADGDPTRTFESGADPRRVDLTFTGVELEAPNQPPTADFTYSPAEPTTEDTIQFTDQSTDPDGTVVAWSWSFGDGGTSTAQNPTHNYADDGTYTVTLTVTDDDGATDSVSKDITVSAPPVPPVNQPPVADAGGPYSVNEGGTVELDGTGSSDPDGDTLTYSWTITDDPTGESSLTNSDTATPTFHAPSVESDTDVIVELTVDDGHGHTDSDTATVTVKVVAPPVNQPPIADAGGPYSVNEGETVVLDGTGSHDPDGTIVSYSWTITDDPTGEASLTGVSTATPTFHAPSVDSNTSVTVTLTVTDDDGATDSDTATVTVKAVAPPPEFPWPAVVAVIIIVIVIVAICYWKREEISRRLRKVLKK